MSKKHQLAKAFDEASMSGKLVDLNEEQAKEFLSLVEDESAFLKKIRKHTTQNPRGTIGKITADGNFLRPGVYNQKNNKDFEFGAEPVEYVTKLFRWSFTVYDSEIRNNIEKEWLESTQLGIIAKKVANDYEETALYSRKRDNPVNIRGMLDGVLWRAEQNGVVMDASDTNIFSDRLVDIAKFRKVQKALNPKFRKDAEWFVSPDVMMDYQDLYTTVADFRVRDDLQSRIAKKTTTECNLLLDDNSILKLGGYNGTVVAGSWSVNQANQNQIEVSDATWLTPGTELDIAYGTVLLQRVTVQAVTGTTITLVNDLDHDVQVNDTIKEVTRDGADCIFTDPMNIVWVQQIWRGSMTFEAERIPSVGWRWHYVWNTDLIVIHDEKLGLLKGLKIK